MVVRVFAATRELLGVSIHGNGMQVGLTTHVKFNVLPSRVKIQGLVLNVMPGNGLVEDIILRVGTFFRVNT
jgi:hypothetical protein